MAGCERHQIDSHSGHQLPSVVRICEPGDGYPYLAHYGSRCKQGSPSRVMQTCAVVQDSFLQTFRLDFACSNVSWTHRKFTMLQTVQYVHDQSMHHIG